MPSFGAAFSLLNLIYARKQMITKADVRTITHLHHLKRRTDQWSHKPVCRCLHFHDFVAVQFSPGLHKRCSQIKILSWSKTTSFTLLKVSPYKIIKNKPRYKVKLSKKLLNLLECLGIKALETGQNVLEVLKYTLQDQKRSDRRPVPTVTVIPSLPTWSG